MERVQHAQPVRAIELDQELAHFLCKGLNGGYVRLWGGGCAQLISFAYSLYSLEFELALGLERIYKDGVVTG